MILLLIWLLLVMSIVAGYVVFFVLWVLACAFRKLSGPWVELKEEEDM